MWGGRGFSDCACARGGPAGRRMRGTGGLGSAGGRLRLPPAAAEGVLGVVSSPSQAVTLKGRRQSGFAGPGGAGRGGSVAPRLLWVPWGGG